MNVIDFSVRDHSRRIAMARADESIDAKHLFDRSGLICHHRVDDLPFD